MTCVDRRHQRKQRFCMSLSLRLHHLLVAVRTAANRARIIAWSRVRDDVGLTIDYRATTYTGLETD